MSVCVPITASTLPEALKDIRSANAIADLIELRLDYLDRPSPENIQKMINECSKPIIATYRKNNPVPLLKAALEAGADYVDVERISPSLPLDKCIYSIHLNEMPPLEELYLTMKGSGAAVIKIVVLAQKFTDNIALLELLKKYPDDKLITFCMGEKGVLSRYFAPAFGSFCTFGSLMANKQSASGQPLAGHLKKWIAQANTTLCGVIGDPISHSLSPAIHQAAYESDKLNYLFLPFHVKRNELKDMLELVRRFPLKGIAVTIPHKEAVIPLLDEVDKEALAIGAVNTIVNVNDQLKGYNTDIFGVMEPIQKRMNLVGKRAVILGGGGAAKAFIYGLQKGGASITVIARDPAKLLDLDCHTVSFNDLEVILKESDILIQTTPVGMSPEAEKTLVPSEYLRKDLLVFDCVYNPFRTRLIKDAEKCGCQTISGLEMFIAQAREQYKLFTGHFADEKIMRKTVIDIL